MSLNPPLETSGVLSMHGIERRPGRWRGAGGGPDRRIGAPSSQPGERVQRRALRAARAVLAPPPTRRSEDPCTLVSALESAFSGALRAPRAPSSHPRTNPSGPPPSHAQLPGQAFVQRGSAAELFAEARERGSL